MSRSSRSRLPVSPANAVVLVVLGVGVVVTILAQRWGEATLLAGAAVAGVVAALYARRPESRDITRVNALEYRDERDSRIARAGLAAVGVVSLVLAVVAFVAATILSDAPRWGTTAQTLAGVHLILLCVTWAVANSVTARRS